MEALRLDICDDDERQQESIPITRKVSRPITNPNNNRPHTIHPSSSIIIKSGILYKKGLGFTGNKYKPRLFELKNNGQFIYYELKSNGQRVKKGEITLSSSTKIEKRSGGTRREAKFIIHTSNRKWYLWCNSASKQNKKPHKKKKPSITPCNNIYKFNQNTPSPNSMISPKRRSTNSIKPTSDKNKTLYPYPYFTRNDYSNQSQCSLNMSINSSSSLLSPNSSISAISPNHHSVNNASSPSRSMMATPAAMEEHSVLTLSKESMEYASPRDSAEIPERSGKDEAMEWCEILTNMIESQRRKERTKQRLLNERHFDDLLDEDESDSTDNEEFEIIQKPRSSMYFVKNMDMDI